LGINRHIIAVAGMVWLTSVIQTLGEHGDNPRFLVPIQMAVIYLIVVAVWSWRKNSIPDKVQNE
jgi:ABC-type branched-subunit amino acid transport system permease subunit